MKDDINWINDGLIEFVPKVTYRFNPRKSKGNRQFEKITTLNMPLIVSFYFDREIFIVLFNLNDLNRLTLISHYLYVF